MRGAYIKDARHILPLNLPKVLVIEAQIHKFHCKQVSRTTLHKLRIGNRTFHAPRSRPIRIITGLVLILCGFFGFLPIIGFWMIPLGILVLSMDVPLIRRGRRRFEVWLGRKRQKMAPNNIEKPRN